MNGAHGVMNGAPSNQMLWFRRNAADLNSLSSGIPGVAGEEGLGGQISGGTFAHGFLQQLSGFVPWLIGQLEGAPVDAE
jgi:hypothetical protein